MGALIHRFEIEPEPFRVFERDRDETIADLLVRSGSARQIGDDWHFLFGLPSIVVIDGAPVLRKDWATTMVPAGTEVALISRPRGGGSSFLQVAGLVGMLGLAIAAPFVGAAVAGWLGVSGTILGVSAAELAAAGIGAAFAVGGSLLINQFLAPKPQKSIDEDTPIPLISAAGNQARPFDAIPVGYGRTLYTPDYAAPPYSEFDHNEQTLFVLLCLGLGRYDVEALRLEDTVFWTKQDGVLGDFPGIDVQIVNPGEEVTLFPINVTTSVEVAGQTIPGAGGEKNGGAGGSGWPHNPDVDPDDPTEGEWLGPFVANAADTQARQLIVDLVFPGGIFRVGEEGELERRSVVVKAEYQEIDAAGDPVSGWQTLNQKTFNAASREPKRYTWRKGVEPGRYQVRVKRNKIELDADEGVDTVIWYALRAHLRAPKTFDDVTLIAVRIEANEETAEQASRRINAIATRRVRVWKPAQSQWVLEPSRSPVWAAVDIWTAAYGAGRPISDTDRSWLAYYAELAESRGDTFDYVFRDFTPTLDAMKAALRVMRSTPIIAGNVLTMVRDEPRAVPAMMLTDREIIRGTFQRRLVFQPDEAADDVIIEFLNEETWEADEVRAKLAGSSSLRPARIRIDGIVNRAQAWREARYLAAVNKFRREYPTLETEFDGRLLKYGDLVRLSSELPDRWGQSCAVIDYDGDRTLRLDPAPDWGGAQRYIEIRTRKGGSFGPVKCSAGEESELAVLNAADLGSVESQQGLTLAQALARADGADLPSAVVGTAGRSSVDAVVMSGEPNGDRTSLVLVVDDDRVHTIDGTEVPPTPIEPPPGRKPVRPEIKGLSARVRQRGADPVLVANWRWTEGAQSYIAQVSADEGETWTPIYRGPTPGFEVPVEERVTLLRVRAVGRDRGPWAEVSVGYPSTGGLKPVLTLSSVLVSGGKGERRRAIKATWGDPIDRRVRGIEFQWRQVGETDWEESTPRKWENRVWRTTKGILRGSTYEVRARFLLRGDRHGPWSDIGTVEAGNTRNPSTDPVPNLTTLESFRTPAGGKGNRKVAIRAVWADPGDQGVRAIVFQWRQTSNPSRVWKETVKDLEVREWDTTAHLLPGTEYEVRARFLFEDDDPGNWTAWLPVTTVGRRTSSDPVPAISVSAFRTTSGGRGNRKVGIKVTRSSPAAILEVRGVVFQWRKTDETSRVWRAVVKDDLSDLSWDTTSHILPSTGYQVRARYLFEDDEPGEWSSWVSVTTPSLRDQATDPAPSLTPSTGSRLVSGNRSRRPYIRVTWTGTTNEVRYTEIRYRETGEEWIHKLVKREDAVSWRTFEGIQPGETYEIQARFIFEDGEPGNWGAAVAVVADANFKLANSTVDEFSLGDRQFRNRHFPRRGIEGAAIDSPDFFVVNTVDADVLRSSTTNSQRAVDSPHLRINSVLRDRMPDDVINTDKVSNNTVTTPLVVAAAISGVATSYTGGQQNTPTSYSGIQESCSISAYGASVLVKVTLQSRVGGGADAGSFGFRLLRNGSVLREFPGEDSARMWRHHYMQYIDSPGPGGVNYQLQVEDNLGFGVVVRRTSIEVTELKR